MTNKITNNNNFNYIVVDNATNRRVSKEELELNENDLILIKINSSIYEKYKKDIEELTRKIQFEKEYILN